VEFPTARVLFIQLAMLSYVNTIAKDDVSNDNIIPFTGQKRKESIKCLTDTDIDNKEMKQDLKIIFRHLENPKITMKVETYGS